MNTPTTRSRRKAILAERRLVLNAMKLERGCADCGYNAHPAALDWDHRDRATKHTEKDSRAFRIEWSWDRILAELAKCEVVCANCHRVRTFTDGAYVQNGRAGAGIRERQPDAPSVTTDHRSQHSRTPAPHDVESSRSPDTSSMRTLQH